MGSNPAGERLESCFYHRLSGGTEHSVFSLLKSGIRNSKKIPHSIELDAFNLFCYEPWVDFVNKKQALR